MLICYRTLVCLHIIAVIYNFSFEGNLDRTKDSPDNAVSCAASLDDDGMFALPSTYINP